MYPSKQLSSRFPAVLLLAALVAALTPSAGVAATDAAVELAEMPPLSADPDLLLAAAKGEAPDEADVEVVVFSVRYTLAADGSATFRQHKIYRVLTGQGAEEWNEVSRTYAPWHQERPVVRARVVIPSGEVHTFDTDTLTDQPVASYLPDTYQDLRRVAAPLPAVAPGVVVEELVEVVDRTAFFGPGVVWRQPLLLGAPVRLARVEVDAPAGTEVRFAARPAELAEPRVVRTEGRVRRLFELRDLEATGGWQPGLPPETVPYPFVAFATGADWPSLARAYSEVVNRQIEAAEGSALARMGDPAPGAETQWEQIAALLERVHDTVRYTGVQLGEAAIVPRSPSETLARRYGDCKDKATLMVALLREIGVPAYVALLRAGSSDDVLPELPGLGGGGFDHAIVYVPGHPALWIDATDPYSALGELPVQAQGRLALVASPDTRGLIRTPVAGAEDNRTGDEREVLLAEFGPGRVVERSVQRGPAAQELRAGWGGLSDEEIIKDLAHYAQASYGSDRVTGLSHSALDRPGPLEMRFEIEDAEWAVTDLAQGLVVVPTPALTHRLPYLGDGEDDRTSDFLVQEPHEIEWLYRIRLPEGFAPRDLPEDSLRAMGPATLSTEMEQAGSEVRARFTFRLDRQRLTADELGELRQAVEALVEEGNLLLCFDNIGWNHLAAGRVEDALVEYRRLEALHPREALHKIQVANALLEVGLAEEARRLGERAVELEPDNAVAHSLFGGILMAGPLGRQFADGFDRDRAIAVLRRARELDPDDIDAAVNLALTLEHDESGRRYADRDGLREAIEVYREVQDQLVGTDYVDNLPIALIRADRPREALEVLGDQPEELDRYALLVAAEALAKGPEAAIRRAERRVSGGRNERAAVLGGAARTLMTLRHYPEAAELMRVASRASASSAATGAFIDALARVRRHDEVEVVPGRPESVLLELLERFFADGFEPEDVERFFAVGWFHDAAQKGSSAAMDAGVLNQMTMDLRALRRLGLPDEAPLDIVKSLAAWTVEERPPLGYQVRMTMDAQILDEEPVVVVERHGDGFRIVGFDDQPEMYGRFAYELALAGDLERARAFLDRALDLSEPAEADDTLLSAGEALHAVWPPAGPEEAGAELLAGAVLAAEDFPDAALVEALREAEPAEGRRMARDQALASALLELARWEEALAVARRIEAANGEDHFLQRSLEGLGRFDELAAHLETAADDEAEEDAARHYRQGLRAESLMRGGRLDEAMAAYEALVQDPEPAAHVYNQAAWLAVIRGDVDEKALEWARLATERSRFGGYPALHTLATVQAELGRPVQAYEALLKAVEARPHGRPDEPDWYVLGRIAEHLGLPEAAREYYRRLKEPEADEDLGSTRRLAQRRLRALGGSGS